MPPTLVVLGSINMDLVSITPRLPEPGETIEGERFYTTPGGKGGNQAVAAARLGANVKMVGRVGDDTFGQELIDGLRSYGIDVNGVASDSHNSSGIANILLDSQRQNYIIAVYGANMACDDEQLEAAKLVLEGADALFLQHEVPIEVSLKAAQYAKSRGVRVIWDPAPARELPSEIYAAVDVLTPNQTEATMLSGIDVVDADSAQAAARVLKERGASAVVVKLGEQGACYATTDDAGFIPAYTVEVVDTIAAGDAFGAALAVALSRGWSMKDAVRYGAAAGALAVTRSGAQTAMPSREDVDKLFSSV